MTDRLARFRALPEAEGRVLVLVDAFSGTADKPRVLEGRLKLAKLDFLVRYPKYLARVLRGRKVSERVIASIGEEPAPLQDRMIRYRYGPWDPSYFAVLGSLIGRGLVDPIPFSKGNGYRVTERGRELAGALVQDGTWAPVHQRAMAARRHLDLGGTKLKDPLYEAIPEMTNAEWHAEVERRGGQECMSFESTDWIWQEDAGGSTSSLSSLSSEGRSSASERDVRPGVGDLEPVPARAERQGSLRYCPT